MLLKRMRTYFITGLLIILPVIVSVYIISFLFVKTTDYIFNILPGIYVNNLQIKILLRVIALGFLITTFILIGMFGRNIIGRRLLFFAESIILKIPLLGRVYVAVKQVSEAFLGYEKTILNKVCLVEYPRRGVFSIGFVTSQTVGEIQYKTQNNLTNIFVPTTPNPTSGVLIMVPEGEFHILDMTIEDGLKMVISGGAVVPPYRPKKEYVSTIKDINPDTQKKQDIRS